jgi:predicted lipid-binding transport protein (Tim44 family)
MANSADIIFFAVVAVYLGIKLFSVLGKKNDQDTKLESRRASFALPEAIGDNKPVMMPQGIKQPEVIVKNKLEDFKFTSDDAKNGIKEIIAKDPSFSIEHFVEGAKIAFEMLLKAFSENDKKTLKSLLSDELFVNFEKHVDDMTAKNHISVKSLVGIDDIEITSAIINGSKFKIGLKFMSEQINVTKDVNGNIIEGDSKKIEVVEDHWEFERNTRSGNPNWAVVSL